MDGLGGFRLERAKILTCLGSTREVHLNGEHFAELLMFQHKSDNVTVLFFFSHYYSLPDNYLMWTE